MPFAVDIADYVIGNIAAHELPEACLRALEEGLESTSLATLAGTLESQYDRIEVEALWASALRELQMTLPGAEAAARVVIRHTADEAIGGKMSIQQALARIVYGVHQATEFEVPDNKIVGDRLGIERLVALHHEYADAGENGVAARADLDREALGLFRTISKARTA